MAEIEKRHHLHIVLTPRQYRLLCSQAKQCRLTKRAYLASLIEGQPVKSRPSQEIKDLRTEIHHIGNRKWVWDPSYMCALCALIGLSWRLPQPG